MKIDSQVYGRVAVIYLHGEFVSEYVSQFTDKYTSAVTDDIAGLVIDMSNVGFIDSVGLETLLATREYCTNNDCQLKLAGLDDNCKKIFEITRMDMEFDTYDELSVAVKSYA